ncbi:hypothetical protein F4819DRAFT_488063 [Hypoxylon fuscum]|nr:hypothetical protein F4819DRAFT_488063 [Hypoxylon fuscum]
MASTNRILALVGITALLVNLGLSQSVPIAYCASINTASTSGNESIYQSDGLCHDFCIDDYAYAIVQDSQCWCSNDTPDKSVQVDTNNCNEQCPGYPGDLCGADGLWGYMSLDKEPTGTKGGSTSTTKTSSPDTTTAEKTTAHTTTATPTPSVSVHTVTAGGTVSLQTVTVAPTSTTAAITGATSDANSTGMTTSHQGLSTGSAVGIAVGVLGAVAIAIGAGVFLWLRRKRRAQGDTIVESPGSHRGSSAGMMSTPTTAMASVWDGDNTSSGRRNSRFMAHDPRMDPYAANIYSRFDNKSHESINTLQDNHDYSRKVLRTTNPDPVDAERD